MSPLDSELTETPTPGYWVHDLSPFLIKFPDGWWLDGLRWYGLSYAAGFLISAWLLSLYYKAKRSPLNADDQSLLMTAGILGVVVGGRLGYVLGYMMVREPQVLLEHPMVIFQVNRGGMASHGGMIGVALATWWASRRFKISLLRLGDLMVTLAPPGIALGRLANFVNGELWGKRTDVPWAVVFRDPDSRAPLWLAPRHPSQLYAFVLEGLVLLAWTQWRFWKKTDLAPGRLAGEFFLGYAIVRIVGEIWREPDVGVPLVMGLSRGQLYSLIPAVAGLALIVYAQRRQRATLT